MKANLVADFDRVALVLQGGGALGSYQAGVFQGLYQADIHPNWISGISIGALNTAIIAGNPRRRRLERLYEFWQYISQPNLGVNLMPMFEDFLYKSNDFTRAGLDAWGGFSALTDGQKGFFSPRLFPALTVGSDDPRKASFYHTDQLKATLEKFCDFDLINSPQHCGHVSVGAVNVRNSHFVYFDNQHQRLIPEHFMASTALPPLFPPVEIDGEFYWDGGVVSNTPLNYVFRTDNGQDTVIFQVDLWSARAQMPTTILQVYDRIKEIQYASRTRLVTDLWCENQDLRFALGQLLENASPEQRRQHAKFLAHATEMANISKFNLIHLIYNSRELQNQNKDYQFNPSAIKAHWDAGLSDIQKTLKCRHFFTKADNKHGLVVHDVHRNPNIVGKTMAAKENAWEAGKSSKTIQTES
ncbi:patatin-like phospholipase family protein [Brackiella oedipodis]|uniref:patatin-like phospholipase family protein n=1 Tax=Brackiella oedipodis TaxID=124225 RepID=UPI000A6DCFE1|nr:patatin-like phospholipase family protein [Brackiella oedipodis]